MKKRAALYFLLAGLSAVLSTGLFNPPAPRLIAPGIFIEGVPQSLEPLKAAEKRAGARFVQVMWYRDWTGPFPEQECRALLEAGYTPHITWEPWDWQTREGVGLDAILSGSKDEYLASWADAAKALKRPVFIRLGHEFNGDWYPWAVFAPGNTPQKFAAAMRYVCEFFKRCGAVNVRWIWCPDVSRPIPEDSYPGDDCVDWIGLDLYNFGAARPGAGWISFARAVYPAYSFVRRRYPAKPIMLAEMGCTENGGDKAGWIREFDRSLRVQFPGILSFVWFNINKETDWRMDSSPAALEAFRALLQNPAYRLDRDGFEKILVQPPDQAPDKSLLSELSAVSASVPILKVEKRRQEITVDGGLDEWLTAEGPAVRIAGKDFLKIGPDLLRASEDLGMNVWCAWDEQALYLAVRVDDDQPGVNTQSGQEIWNGDCVELTLGLNPDSNPQRLEYDRTDWQIGFAPGTAEPNGCRVYVWRGPTAETASVEAKTQKTSSGYEMEIRLPWNFLGLSSPTELKGKTFSINFAVDDADATGMREKQMVWSGNEDFYLFPSLWGKATLKE